MSRSTNYVETDKSNSHVQDPAIFETYELCKFGPQNRKLYNFLYTLLIEYRIPEPLIYLIFMYDEAEVESAHYGLFYTQGLTEFCRFPFICPGESFLCIICQQMKLIRCIIFNRIKYLGNRPCIWSGDIPYTVSASTICENCIPSRYGEKHDFSSMNIERKNGELIAKNMAAELAFICANKYSVIVFEKQIVNSLSISRNCLYVNLVVLD